MILGSRRHIRVPSLSSSYMCAAEGMPYALGSTKRNGHRTTNACDARVFPLSMWHVLARCASASQVVGAKLRSASLIEAAQPVKRLRLQRPEVRKIRKQCNRLFEYG